MLANEQTRSCFGSRTDLKPFLYRSEVELEEAGLFHRFTQAGEEISYAYEVLVEGWVRTLALRDNETEEHTRRVTLYSMNIARALKLSEDELTAIRWGALLHDIGKIGIPDEILRKPGPLSEDEWKIMRLHPELAYELLAPIPYFRSALEVPLCHHEKWDGSGYPGGLRGEQIPLFARIFAVPDVWDALTSNRPYRAAWKEEDAFNFILGQSGKQFDPQIVQAFFLCYPRPGSSIAFST